MKIFVRTATIALDRVVLAYDYFIALTILAIDVYLFVVVAEFVIVWR